MNTYPIGTLVTMSANFIQETNGLPVDPTDVFLIIQNPLGVKTTISGADVTKERVGRYSHDRILDVSGVWTYRWEGVGDVQATTLDILMMAQASNIVAG